MAEPLIPPLLDAVSDVNVELAARATALVAAGAQHDTDVAAINSLTTLTRDQAENVVQLEGQLAAKDAEIRVRDAEIARLQAIIDGEPPPDPDPDPPTTTRTMKVGAIIGSQCHTVAQYISQVGTPGVRRYFNANDFASITQNTTVAADMGKWDRLISYKATTVNATKLNTCLNSIPQDGRRTVIMCQNEPERSDKNDFTASSWRTYVNAFIEQTVGWIDQNDRDDVFPGWSFSYWRPLTDPTIADWWPTSPNRARAVFGCQSYDPLNKKTLEQQTKIPVDRWRTAAGDPDAPWMLSEVNTHRTGTDGAKWWNDGFAWAASYGCLWVAAYDDVVGKDGPWCIVDPTVQNALGDHMPSMTVNV